MSMKRRFVTHWDSVDSSGNQIERRLKTNALGVFLGIPPAAFKSRPALKLEIDVT